MDLIKRYIPETFYAELPDEERLKMLVKHWQRAIKVNQELEEKISKSAGNWVNVSEKLPEQIGDEVDIFVKNDFDKRNFRITNAEYEGEGYFLKDGLSYYCKPVPEIKNRNTYVTHWCKISKPSV